MTKETYQGALVKGVYVTYGRGRIKHIPLERADIDEEQMYVVMTLGEFMIYQQAIETIGLEKIIVEEEK